MQLRDFNTNTELPRYTYRRCELHARAFQIFRHEDNEKFKPVGNYTVLDQDENIDLSEKKVMNIISELNGRRLMDLSDQVDGRTHFQIINDGSDGNNIKVMFLEKKVTKGVSVESGLFEIERDETA